ncbi:unnamed protein product [Musa textilis]
MTSHPCNLRSISMPSRPHPVMFRVEEELCELRTFVAASSPSSPQMISDGLRELVAAYESIKEVLRLPCSHCSLQKKWLEDELDGSVRLLDLCGDLKDGLAMIKDHIKDLRLALRRRDVAAAERTVNAYLRFTKKAGKDVKNCFRSLKVEGKCADKDCGKPIASRLLMELKAITLSLLHLVPSFLSMQTGRWPKTGRWPFVSKALSKKQVACEREHGDGNGIERSDLFSLHALLEYTSCKDGGDGKVVKFHDQLQMLEDNTKAIESGLECLFKQLIQSRVHLLNNLSS